MDRWEVAKVSNVFFFYKTNNLKVLKFHCLEVKIDNSTWRKGPWTLHCAHFCKGKKNSVNYSAELMLNEFYNIVTELYGEATCTYNMHQLYHIANYVKLLGPL